MEFDKSYPLVANNVRLGLAANGFNPFGNTSLSYNMWPVVLTTYNLPSWLCMKPEYLMLTLLIRPQSLGKDMYILLLPLIDKLNELWVNGLDTHDTATDNGVFRMRAVLLWTINDFPTRSSLSGWSG